MDRLSEVGAMSVEGECRSFRDRCRRSRFFVGGGPVAVERWGDTLDDVRFLLAVADVSLTCCISLLRWLEGHDGL